MSSTSPADHGLRHVHRHICHRVTGSLPCTKRRQGSRSYSREREEQQLLQSKQPEAGFAVHGRIRLPRVGEVRGSFCAVWRSSEAGLRKCAECLGSWSYDALRNMIPPLRPNFYIDYAAMLRGMKNNVKYTKLTRNFHANTQPVNLYNH
jgi:hypothetical protein